MADPKRRKNSSPSYKKVRTENYNIKTLHEDREYGLYWYAWLWKILRPVLIFLCSILIVVGIVSFGYEKIYDGFIGPVDKENTGKVDFEIESGSSVSEVGSNLEEQALIHNSSVFKYLVQLKGLGGKISYGTFELSPSMNVNEIVAELTGGSQTNERIITIVPGWTCEDIADYLFEEGAIDSVQEFLNACNDVDRFVGHSYALRNAQDTGRLANRKYALEGYLSPDTYRIFKSASVDDIIEKLLAQNNTVIDNVYYADNRQFEMNEDGIYTEVETYKSDLTMDQYITLASIIEKEAAKTEDYAKVSAIFHNRLRLGWKLESCPTAVYLEGISKYVLTQEEINDQNAYNTYVIDALPAGPICNPSITALRAAMQPDMDFINQGYMFFCSTDPNTDVLAFSVTREEHLANVAKYQTMWAEYDAQNGIR